MSIFSSVVVLDLVPSASQIASESAAEKNIEMLVAARVRMFRATNYCDAAEMFAVAGAVTPENNHDAAVIIARTPKPVALMIANRFRQTKSWSEEIDRARLTVTVCKNCRPHLLFRRK